MRATTIASLVLLACHLSGCGDDGTPAASAQLNTPDGGSKADAGLVQVAPIVADDGAAPAPPAAEVTYADVAPIFSRACLQCHSPGQIGPFSFETYEKARPFAPLMAQAVRARTMPPSVIDASGACNGFPDITWLSEDEIRTIEQWAELGAPDSATGPVASADPPALPKLAGETHTIRTPTYTPSKKLNDDYRCFVVESPFDEDTFITGFDMKPANAATAHHMVLFYPLDDLSASVASLNDALEEGPGYTCFGGAGTLATVIAAWAPGGGATNYPANLGVKVAAHRPLIVQMHYNTAAVATATPEVTEITIASKRDAVPGALLPMVDLDLSIPPGESAVDYVAKGTLAGKAGRSGPVEVYGVFPHMHELGKSIKVTWGGAKGEDTCMVDAPRYSFHWQRMYFFDQPKLIDADDPIAIRCTFDTRSRTEPTKWGEGTADEMCVIGLFVKL
jgi:Copper type II ascorbate-dependent monooxygenase, C-terminal domain/Copper type II ascorbate-dependent monooxygenase, N-terminal domain